MAPLYEEKILLPPAGEAHTRTHSLLTGHELESSAHLLPWSGSVCSLQIACLYMDALGAAQGHDV